MTESLPLLNVAILCIGTLFVSFFVSAIGPTGGLQLATVAATVPASMIIPMHAWITGFSALFRAWGLRNRIDWRYTMLFSAASLAASVLAIGITLRLNPYLLSIIVGGYILVAAIRLQLRFLKTHTDAVPKPKTPVITGLLTGFLTVFIGATGPLLFAILAERFADRRSLIATHSSCLVVQHLSKIVLFGVIGVTIFDYWPVLAVVLGCAWAGTRLGQKTLLKLDETVYRRLLAAVLAAGGIFIILRAWLALTGNP